MNEIMRVSRHKPFHPAFLRGAVLRRVIALAIAGLATAGLVGCSHSASGPADLAQQHAEVRGGPQPHDSLQKFMAKHPNAISNATMQIQKPPGSGR
jgi:hypothetical protein